MNASTELPTQAQPPDSAAAPKKTDQEPPTAAELKASVKQKLRGSILRRLAGARHLGKNPHYLVYCIYSWAHESLLLVGTLGLSHPVVSLVAGTEKTPAGQNAWQAVTAYPTPLLITVGAFLGTWFLIRVWVSVQKLVERGPLMAACKRELGTIEADLESALAETDPMPPLLKVMEQAKEVVDRYFKSGVWPWPIGPIGDDVDSEVSRHAEELCARHEGAWKVAQ
ncbi:MAG: hypothetical protein KF795_33055 [Labilithrix sp.]|nr:hypothetical protein [Labilithrix sp.]